MGATAYRQGLGYSMASDHGKASAMDFLRSDAVSEVCTPVGIDDSRTTDKLLVEKSLKRSRLSLCFWSGSTGRFTIPNLGYLLLGGLVLNPLVVVHTKTFRILVVLFAGPCFRHCSTTLAAVVTQHLVLDAGRQSEVLVVSDLMHEHSDGKESCKSKAEEKRVGGRVAEPGLRKTSVSGFESQDAGVINKPSSFAFSVSAGGPWARTVYLRETVLIHVLCLECSESEKSARRSADEMADESLAHSFRIELKVKPASSQHKQ
jgi:hypothetical protein